MRRPHPLFDADTMARPPAGDRLITDPAAIHGVDPAAMVYGQVAPRVVPGMPGNAPPEDLPQNILSTLWNAGTLTPPEQQIGKQTPPPAAAANTAATSAAGQSPNAGHRQPVGAGALAMPSSLHIKASTIPEQQQHPLFRRKGSVNA